MDARLNQYTHTTLADGAVELERSANGRLHVGLTFVFCGGPEQEFKLHRKIVLNISPHFTLLQVPAVDAVYVRVSVPGVCLLLQSHFETLKRLTCYRCDYFVFLERHRSSATMQEHHIKSVACQVNGLPSARSIEGWELMLV